MERRDLYQDDLTEEREATPAQRDDVARTQTLDPEILAEEEDDIDDVDDDDEDEDEDDEENVIDDV
jgi:hypothetical protein